MKLIHQFHFLEFILQIKFTKKHIGGSSGQRNSAKGLSAEYSMADIHSVLTAIKQRDEAVWTGRQTPRVMMLDKNSSFK